MAETCEAINTQVVRGHTLRCDLGAGHEGAHLVRHFHADGITITDCTFTADGPADSIARLDM